MLIDIGEKDLKHSLLGLVIALVEIITETLKLQAVRRMESGSLTEAEIARLGEALLDLDLALQEIKAEQGLAQSVKAVRDGLDKVVEEVTEQFLDPDRWLDEPRLTLPSSAGSRSGIGAGLDPPLCYRVVQSLF